MLLTVELQPDTLSGQGRFTFSKCAMLAHSESKSGKSPFGKSTLFNASVPVLLVAGLSAGRGAPTDRCMQTNRRAEVAVN